MKNPKRTHYPPTFRRVTTVTPRDLMCIANYAYLCGIDKMTPKRFGKEMVRQVFGRLLWREIPIIPNNVGVKKKCRHGTKKSTTKSR